MTISDYILLLNKPDAVHEKQTSELENIVQQFPYFQSARALHLKGLYNQNSFKYNYALKVTAAHTIDRSILFDFITSDSFTAVDRKVFDEQLSSINDIKVQESEIVKDESHITEVVIEKIPNEDFFEAAIEREDDAFAKDESAAVEIDDIAAEEEEKFEAEVEEVEEVEIEEAEPEEETTEAPEVHINKLEQSILNSIRVSSPTVETGEVIPDDIEEPVVAEIKLEPLEIGKPLNFETRETHSFQEWLQLSAMKPIDRSLPADKVPEEEDDRQKKNDLIDRFIRTNPKIPPIKSDVPKPAPSVFEASNDPDKSYLMTETLARVYLEQHKYQKAIQAYEILILKYPEKSSFFADRILDIKNLQQK